MHGCTIGFLTTRTFKGCRSRKSHDQIVSDTLDRITAREETHTHGRDLLREVWSSLLPTYCVTEIARKGQELRAQTTSNLIRIGVGSCVLSLTSWPGQQAARPRSHLCGTAPATPVPRAWNASKLRIWRSSCLIGEIVKAHSGNAREMTYNELALERPM